eukprot:233393_1
MSLPALDQCVSFFESGYCSMGEKCVFEHSPRDRGRHVRRSPHRRSSPRRSSPRRSPPRRSPHRRSSYRSSPRRRSPPRRSSYRRSPPRGSLSRMSRSRGLLQYRRSPNRRVQVIGGHGRGRGGFRGRGRDGFRGRGRGRDRARGRGRGRGRREFNRYDEGHTSLVIQSRECSSEDRAPKDKCSHWRLHGYCRFGTTCRFLHIGAGGKSTGEERQGDRQVVWSAQDQRGGRGAQADGVPAQTQRNRKNIAQLLMDACGYS